MRGKPYVCNSCNENRTREPGWCRTCKTLGPPDVRIKNEMASSARGVVICFGMAILSAMMAHHVAVPHPKGWLPAIVVGLVGVSSTCISISFRYICEWLDYRDKYRLEICKKVHES